MGEEAQATISFRAMTEADIPALVGIEAQSFYDAWNENMLRNEIANELTTYLVMECAGKLVGYAGFWLVAGEAQITRVAVADEERGQGYGTRLTAALVNKAWELGATAMTLEVRESNAVAQHLYATLDFEQNGFRPKYYSDTNEGALLLWNMDNKRTLERERAADRQNTQNAD